MAITLVTGLPGHGKTLYTLSRWKDEAAKAGRPVFHNDIKGLNIPGWQPWKVDDWEQLPAGSIMVVDEAQFAFPVTGRGQTPLWVQKLATHRHLGLDFVVITQNPMLLDSFVRKLVDRHFHVVRLLGLQRATIYEFPNGVQEQVGKSRAGGIRHEWAYPKDVFDLYQSAELHTVKRRIPMRLYVMVAMPVLFIALAYAAYLRLNPEAQQARINDQVGVVGTGTGHSATPGGGQGVGKGGDKQTPLEYAESFTPRVAGLPHTAPAYDEVTKPSQAPYPAACVSMGKRCACYTQQGTKLDTGADLCRQIADGGFFVAWANAQQAPAQSNQAYRQPLQPVAQLVGFDAGSMAPARTPAADPATGESGGEGTYRPRVRR